MPRARYDRWVIVCGGGFVGGWVCVCVCVGGFVCVCVCVRERERESVLLGVFVRVFVSTALSNTLLLS